MQLPYKRSPAQTRQNVLPIDRLPRYVRRLSDVNIIAWMVQATQLTIHQILTRPRLARERLLTALKRERRAERKRRIEAAWGNRRRSDECTTSVEWLSTLACVARRFVACAAG